MTRIVASDILIADVITAIEGNPSLQALVEKHQLKKGGKIAVSKPIFDTFTQAIEGKKTDIMAGGSSANVLTTLAGIMSKEISIDFISAIGNGPYDDMIRRSLEGIHLIPDTFKAKPITATSYVFMFPDGQRTIVTYTGNAREVLTADMISDVLIKNADAVLIQGSLWAKMEEAYADRFFNLSKQHKKEIWLALPTYSMPSGQHVDRFQDAIASAGVVLGNEEELARIYTTDTTTALLKLQKGFSKKQVGFITLGDKGATLVTASSINKIKPPRIKVKDIVNTLGAGDTAFAGFLAGYLKHFTHNESAKIAMALAVEKLKVNGPRLPDSKAAMQKVFPDFYN